MLIKPITAADHVLPLMATSLPIGSDTNSRTMCHARTAQEWPKEPDKVLLRSNTSDPNLIEHLWDMPEQVRSMDTQWIWTNSNLSLQGGACMEQTFSGSSNMMLVWLEICEIWKAGAQLELLYSITMIFFWTFNFSCVTRPICHNHDFTFYILQT